MRILSVECKLGRSKGTDHVLLLLRAIVSLKRGRSPSRFMWVDRDLNLQCRSRRWGDGKRRVHDKRLLYSSQTLRYIADCTVGTSRDGESSQRNTNSQGRKHDGLGETKAVACGGKSKGLASRVLSEAAKGTPTSSLSKLCFFVLSL